MHNADNIVKWIRMVRQFHTRFELDYGTEELRIALHNEELGELRQAIADNNKVEILDGLCDLVYISCGTMLYFENKSNAKVYGIPEYSLVYTSINELICSAIDYPLNSICNCNICIEIAKCYNLPLDWAFAQVHYNNMKKVWTKEQVEALPADCLYAIKQLGENEYAVKSQQGKLLKPPGHAKPDLDPMNLLK